MADSRETIAVTAILTSPQSTEDGIIFHERTAIPQSRMRQIVDGRDSNLFETIYQPPKTILEVGLNRLRSFRKPRAIPSFPVARTSR
jgi:hypothetical protein